MAAALVRLGLVRTGEPLAFVPLTGGVSSDIVQVDIASRRICVKRALSAVPASVRPGKPVS